MKAAQTIRGLLDRNAAEFADREAVVAVSYCTGRWVRHTWKEIHEISDRVAAGLAKLGIRKGQKVACMLANNVESYYVYLAIHKIGAVFVPINIRLVPREVEYIVENADADFLIALDGVLPLVEQIRDRLRISNYVGVAKEGRDLPAWVTMSFAEIMATTGKPPAVAILPDDVADIVYTSGTTGLPKGVVFLESNKVACGRLFGTAMGFTQNRYSPHRVQTAFPFFTSAGCGSVMMIWLYFAFTIIIEEAFDVTNALEIMQREKTTAYAGAPAIYAFMLSHPRFHELKTASVRVAISGASATPEALIRKMGEEWPGIRIYNTYSLTEGGPGGTVLGAAEALTKIGSIGLPMPPEQEARIVDVKGMDVKAGEVGEIILKGPSVMKEYYKNPEATAETLRGGWLHTGDMGYYDEEGYFFYTDRGKDMIVRGGFNIYSVEVENCLCEHPAVKQCAVIAKPHEQLGEDILVFVVLKEGSTVQAEELYHFTKDKLADFKRPRDIRFIDALPLNPTGKVDKKTLRARLREGSL